ncbi:MAG TPA: YcgL domain-containing protein [Xanthomonadales bacterium]|nr:YcgL domain-containing protein [Xanthomonadales bacterium]
MRTFVYKSTRRDDTYVYLAERDAFGVLPAPLAERLGKLVFVLEVDLTPERKLARTDPAVVRANLAAHGFHLQVPPMTALPGDEAW